MGKALVSEMAILSRFLSSISYPRELKLLRKEQAHIYKLCAEETKRAREEKWDAEKLRSMEFGQRDDIEMIHAQIDIFISNYWIGRANHFITHVPGHDEKGMWEFAHKFGVHHLTSKGVDVVRRGVREEEKALREPLTAIAKASWAIVGASVAALVKYMAENAGG